VSKPQKITRWFPHFPLHDRTPLTLSSSPPFPFKGSWPQRAVTLGEPSERGATYWGDTRPKKSHKCLLTSPTLHQRAFVFHCGACAGTAQVGVSLITPLDSPFKRFVCVFLLYSWHKTCGFENMIPAPRRSLCTPARYATIPILPSVCAVSACPKLLRWCIWRSLSPTYCLFSCSYLSKLSMNGCTCMKTPAPQYSLYALPTCGAIPISCNVFCLSMLSWVFGVYVRGLGLCSCCGLVCDLRQDGCFRIVQVYPKEKR